MNILRAILQTTELQIIWNVAKDNFEGLCVYF